MPSIKVEGMDEIFAILKSLQKGGAIEAIQKQAVYAGMAVIRDEVVKQIQALPEEKGYIKAPDLPRNVITPREKEGLLKHIGIADIEVKNGTADTKISFDDYIEEIRTAKHPKGLPAALLARSINSGSSVRQKHPFMRQAQAAAKTRAIEAAQKAADEALKKLLEG